MKKEEQRKNEPRSEGAGFYTAILATAIKIIFSWVVALIFIGIF